MYQYSSQVKNKMLDFYTFVDYSRPSETYDRYRRSHLQLSTDAGFKGYLSKYLSTDHFLLNLCSKKYPSKFNIRN